jgi:hypothetical protein
MTNRTQLNRKDPDFDDFEVFIYGIKQDSSRVISADAEKREVWRYQVDAEGKVLPADEDGEPPRELAAGTVTIKPKRPETQAATATIAQASERSGATARGKA